MLSPQRATSDPEHVSFDAPRGSSDRNFGLTFAIFFLVLGLWPIVRGDLIRVWSLIVAALLFGVAFFSPHLFAVPNRLWFRFGLVLGKFITPIVVVTLFLVAILPVALILRMLGKDIHWPSPGSDPRNLLGAQRGARPNTRITQRSILEAQRMSFAIEFLRFLSVRKKYWLLPIILVMVLFGGLVVLTQGSAVAPFIYTLF